MAQPPSRSQAILNWVERTGNRLPDPAVHFLIALALTWSLSLLLSGVDFGEVDPRTGEALRIVNQLTPEALAGFLSTMVTSFVGFPPLGVVLVMVLGVGVAEHSGLVGAGLKQLLDVTPVRPLTPMLAVEMKVGSSFWAATRPGAEAWVAGVRAAPTLPQRPARGKL